MFLQRLKLIQFKNYLQKEFAFGRGFNCLSGSNGMGKTNVLEAICYLCLTKSCRGLQDRQLVLHGKDFFRLEGDFGKEDFSEKSEEKLEVVAKVIPGKRKEISLNGVPYTRLADHVGCIPLVFIAPDDHLLVMEGGEVRRRFLDLSLSQIDHTYLYELMKYNKLVKQRNYALKQFAEQKRFDATLIQGYDSQIAPLGDLIFHKRREFVEEFLPHFLYYHSLITEGKEEVSCVYRSSLEQAGMAELLREQLDRDRLLQRTSMGVHRDDLLFSLSGKSLRKFGSQGQIKSFVLALKLAQYRLLFEKKKVKPLLLLDDLFDKLDASRVLNLLQLLSKEPFGQIFITHTESEALRILFAESGIETPVHYCIEPGSVQKL